MWRISVLLLLGSVVQGSILTSAQLSAVGPLLSKRGPTIIAFSAKWCTACEVLHEDLNRELSRRPDVTLRIIDVERDPIASKFSITALPDVLVFDANGSFLGEIVGADVIGILQKLGKSKKVLSL